MDYCFSLNMGLTFAVLLALRTSVAWILGFHLSQGHRTLIPATAILQAVWLCWWGRNNYEPWLQLVGVLIGIRILISCVERLAAQLSPTASVLASGHTDPSQNSNYKSYGPWLLPCKTSHMRQFPKKHGFAYSYLQVAFQVGPSGIHGGSLLGIETKAELGDPSTWFHISADKYLFRGPSTDGTLYGKLREYLKTEGVDISKLPYIFLVTAPKFLGYSFNPVSFWYLYDQQNNLKYMLLEVNNTFDERRMYLLDRQYHPDSDLDAAAKSEQKTTPFRQSWPKDFHVSPFNSRKGSYSLMAQDPGFLSDQASPQIDNTITLRSSKTHPKLVARLFSTGPAVSVDALTLRQKVNFIASWCWVGFVTFPRILYEAARLFFSRGLHVWFRPEVLRSSIGRQATWRETAIGELFGQFLQRQCRDTNGGNQSGKVKEDRLNYVPVKYTHALAIPGPRTWYLGVADAPTTSVEESRANAAMALQVLSPGFYAQYAVDRWIMSRELLPQEHMFSVRGAPAAVPNDLRFSSDTNDTRAERLIAGLLESSQSSQLADDLGHVWAPWRWRLLTYLRTRRWSRQEDKPDSDSSTVTSDRKSADCSHSTVLGRKPLASHPMDSAVYSICSRVTDVETQRKAEAYRKAVTGLLLAQIFAFGSPELLDVLIWLFTTSVVWLGVAVVGHAWAAKEFSYPAAAAASTLLLGLVCK